jgi:hypothetical protein
MVYTMTNNAFLVAITNCFAISNACLVVTHTSLPIADVAVCREGGGRRRPTLDPTVNGRAIYESNGFDKESLSRSMKMTVPTMAPHTNFKQWKRNFLTLLYSHKAAYMIP